MDLKETMLSQNNYSNYDLSQSQILTRIETNISKTYAWMWWILLIVFAVAYWVFNLFLQWVINPSQYFIGSIASALGWFGLVVWMSFGWSKMKYSTLSILFVIFWILEGFWLAWIFMVYNLTSIIQVFMTTSIMFIILAFAWYTLKVDTTKLWSILMVAIIALLVGMVINLFWQNAEFNIWINIIWIVIFSGFVIYDMAVLKENAATPDNRIQIIMALALFLDFINIFLFLLRLFGSSRD